MKIQAIVLKIKANGPNTKDTINLNINRKNSSLVKQSTFKLLKRLSKTHDSNFYQRQMKKTFFKYTNMQNQDI